MESSELYRIKVLGFFSVQNAIYRFVVYAKLSPFDDFQQLFQSSVSSCQTVNYYLCLVVIHIHIHRFYERSSDQLAFSHDSATDSIALVKFHPNGAWSQSSAYGIYQEVHDSKRFNSHLF